MALFGMKSLAQNHVLEDAEADYRTSVRVEQFRVSDKAIYFPAFPGNQYIPFEAMSQIKVRNTAIKDCYAALGIMHEKYKPIPGRFKDYIAMPKPNMYQSLHTTLIGPSGQPFEIQIRTFEMHRTAEYGIAAHWKYKEANNGGGTSTTVTEEEKLSWLRQILEWQQDMSDSLWKV